VRDADVFQRHGIEAHHLGRHRVDGDLIRAGQHVVLDHRDHGARPGAVARGGAVHDGEDAGVDFFLDGQQIHQGAVNPTVRVVAVRGQESAKGVLHRAGGRGVDVTLGRGQVDDVLAQEVVGDANPVGKTRGKTCMRALGLYSTQRMSLSLKL